VKTKFKHVPSTTLPKVLLSPQLHANLFGATGSSRPVEPLCTKAVEQAVLYIGRASFISAIQIGVS
jgi:hypothetical protein